MLRPNFVRSQVGDIEMFERHVQNVLRAIPRDGLMVKLDEVFFSMTLDVATDFLLGESTGCLAGGGGNRGAKEFARAFNYAQNALGGQEGGGWGILDLFLPNGKLKEAYKECHCESLSSLMSSQSVTKAATLIKTSSIRRLHHRKSNAKPSKIRIRQTTHTSHSLRLPP